MNRSIKALITIVIAMILFVTIYITFSNGKEEYEIYQKTVTYETKDTETGKVINKERVVDQGLISTSHYLILAIECTIIGMIASIAISTKGFKDPFKETFNSGLKIGKAILIVLIVKLSVQFPIYILLKNDINQTVSVKNTLRIKGDSEGQIVYNSQIDLSQYKETNISIKQGGEYTITGEFSNTIIVDSIDPVTLNLDNVTINNIYSGIAIKNERNNTLNINLKNGSTNTFISNGEGANDVQGTIVSNGNITIYGDGQLIIENNQLTGYAINCTSGIEIVSGIINISALHSGILHKSENSSIQIKGGALHIYAENDPISTNKTLQIERGVIFLESNKNSETDYDYVLKDGTFIAVNDSYISPNRELQTVPTVIFNLNDDDIIDDNKIITLTDANKNAIVSFLSKVEVENIIISSKNIKLGDSVYLFKDGTNNGILVNNVYYNGTYKPGSDAIKKKNAFPVTRITNEYS